MPCPCPLHRIFISADYTGQKWITDTKEVPYEHHDSPGTARRDKAAQTRLAARRDHRTFRRLTQLAAGFIAAGAVQHSWPGAGGTATSASPEAFCPFGGVETLYQYVTGGGTFGAHTHLSNLVLPAAVLLTALLLRSAFCGWIGPFGFLQDLLHGASTALQKRVMPVRRAVRFLKTRGAGRSRLDRPLRWLKCVGACPREGALAVTIGWANHPT